MQQEKLKSILDYFYEWEARQPDAVFLRQPYGKNWTELSWQESGRQARKMAAALQNMGLQAGDKVGIISKNCYHWVIADLAIMMGGFVSTPFYPNLTASQLNTVIELSDCKALFVGKLDEWEELQTGIPDAVECIAFPHYPNSAPLNATHQWDELLASHDPLPGNPLPDIHDLWTIIFTSGTTGTPKGVMHTYYAPAAMMKNERTHGNLKVFEGEEHHYFSYLPLNHIAERVIVEIAAMMTGGNISFAESLDSFAQNLQDTQPTLFMGVPRIYTKFQLAILERMPQKRLTFLLGLPLINRLVRKKIKKGLGLSRARIVLTGAAPTPDVLKNWYLELGIRLQEVYAMTENLGGCALMPIDALRPGTVGIPLPNVDLRIEPETGEVIMKAPWLMKGYYKADEKSAHVMKDGWLHTGDQGRLTSEGYLQLTGRVSDTFKSAKGKYIVPAPIEWGFAKNNYIEQICVVGLAVPQPLALVNLSEVGKLSEPREVQRSLEETLKTVNEGLARYERIKTIIIMDEPWAIDNGVLTPTMKIKREVLNLRYHKQFERWYAAKSPVIWEKTIKTKHEQTLE